MATRQMRFNQRCEICFIEFYSGEGYTVCDPCDEKLQLEIKARKNIWAERYKCRSCNQGLPLSRAIYCEICVRPEERVSDDIYEELLVSDEFSYVPMRSSHWRIEPPSEKACTICKVVKDKSKFSKERTMRCPLSSACLECRWKRAQLKGNKQNEDFMQKM